jgi:hypothetical protein
MIVPYDLKITKDQFSKDKFSDLNHKEERRLRRIKSERLTPLHFTLP